MRNISQPTEEMVCEECGLRRKEWTGNSGRGVEARGVLACCQGCCEGAGCTCKETGVRRVVVVRSDSGISSVQQTRRKIKSWQSGLSKLASRSRSN